MAEGANNRLREVIEAAGGVLADWTVLSIGNDPYRFHTDEHHEIGKWFSDQLALYPGPDGRRHLRGLHYAMLTSSPTKPNGETYRNTFANWKWLTDKAAKCARWLGYVSFDSIIDARNDPPIVREREQLGVPRRTMLFDPVAELGETEVNIEPVAVLEDFERDQPYRLAFFGEKSSLEPIMVPLAERFNADLYLGAGELSDTLIHKMAKTVEDGESKLIVFTMSDFDPSGHQMPISIGRKLQALRDLLFPDLQFEVHPVALTLDQAIALDLPSEPLKETEKRADNWREAMGREQTEIDAAVELHADYLTTLLIDAIAAYFDETLASRIETVRDDWRSDAQTEIDKVLDPSIFEDLTDEAEQVIRDAESELDDIKERASDAIESVTVNLPPMPPVPNANCTGNGATMLVDSDWTWEDQTLALKKRKAYVGEDDDLPERVYESTDESRAKAAARVRQSRARAREKIDMSRKCLICGTEFEAKRKDAVVCSKKCKHKHIVAKRNARKSADE